MRSKLTSGRGEKQGATVEAAQPVKGSRFFHPALKIKNALLFIGSTKESSLLFGYRGNVVDVFLAVLAKAALVVPSHFVPISRAGLANGEDRRFPMRVLS